MLKSKEAVTWIYSHLEVIFMVYSQQVMPTIINQNKLESFWQSSSIDNWSNGEVYSDVQEDLQIDWRLTELSQRWNVKRLLDVVKYRDNYLATSASLTAHYTQTTARHHIINFKDHIQVQQQKACDGRVGDVDARGWRIDTHLQQDFVIFFNGGRWEDGFGWNITLGHRGGRVGLGSDCLRGYACNF